MLSQQNIPKFDPQLYTQIALNDLVTYAVYFLGQVDAEITTEDIVAACFFLFPKRFALRGYDQWPDSTVVNKRWVDCRKRGLIMGSTARGFSITPKGLELAEKVTKTLTGKRPVLTKTGKGKVRAETRTRAGRFVRALEESEACRLFQQNGEQMDISEFDFRSMLLCTMESSTTTLRNNLEQFRQSAAFYERMDLLKLLDFCSKKFANLFADTTQQKKQYRGGMLRQKIK